MVNWGMQLECLMSFKRIFNVFLSTALGTLIFSSAVNVSASVIESDDIQKYNSEEQNLSIVHLRESNSSGISVNYFSSFDVDSPVQFLNATQQAVSGDVDDIILPAKLIVIVADTINIESSISLLGSTADILFITTSSSGDILCDGCSFSNFQRITLAAAAAEDALDYDITQIGVLTAVTGGEVSLNGVSAPGVLSFEVIAKTATNIGVVDLNEKANRLSTGVLENSDSGNLTVGTGEFKTLMGPVIWDYDNNEVISITLPTSSSFVPASYSFHGDIRAKAVSITAAGNLNVLSKIDTRSDVVASSGYGGSVYIPSEAILIQTLGVGDLDIQGNKYSNGTIRLRATEDLDINLASTLIEADNIEILAQSDINNIALLKAGSMSLAGYNVINRGELNANVLMEIWSDRTLANEYGGVLIADDLRLMSENYVVRNGSRTPYVSNVAETNSFLNLFLGNNVDEMDTTRLGTYYSLLTDDSLSVTDLQRPQDNSAHIIARRLQVTALAFENINPYFLAVEDSDEVTIDLNLASQVSVSAEEYLGVDAANYVVNSSARIAMNDANGSFIVNTAQFTNERYRTVTVLDKEEYTTEEEATSSGGWVHNVTTDTYTTIRSRTVAYAPPGQIVSMGNLSVSATQAVLNNTAYLEIFGNAHFSTPYIHVFGVANDETTRVLSETNQTRNSHNGTVVSSGESFSTAVVSTELDSLFFVQGNLEASAATSWYKNHLPLQNYLDAAVDEYIASNLSTLGNRSESEYTQIGISAGSKTVYSYWTDVELSYDYAEAIESGVINLEWTESGTEETHIRFGTNDPSITEVDLVQDGSTLIDSVITLLSDYYETIKSSIDELLSKLSWWN